MPPEEQLATGKIPVCAETEGKAIYRGYISPTGVVTQDKTSFSEPATSGKGPCHSWLMQEGKKMQAQQAATPPPVRGQGLAPNR